METIFRFTGLLAALVLLSACASDGEPSDYEHPHHEHIHHEHITREYHYQQSSPPPPATGVRVDTGLDDPLGL